MNCKTPFGAPNLLLVIRVKNEQNIMYQSQTSLVVGKIR
jgi:hypothetical protein